MIKLLRKNSVLNTGLNFCLFLKFKVLVLRTGRRSWSSHWRSYWIIYKIVPDGDLKFIWVWFSQCLILWAKGKDDANWSLLFSFILVGKVRGETRHAYSVIGQIQVQKNCSNSRVLRPDRLSYVTLMIYATGESRVSYTRLRSLMSPKREKEETRI